MTNAIATFDRQIKRINIGMAVRTTDLEIYGNITAYTESTVTITVAGSDIEATVERDEIEKATKEELEQAIAQVATDEEDVEVVAPESSFNRLASKAKNDQYVLYISTSGKKSLDNGDEVAIMLRGKTLDEVYQITSDWVGISVEELIERYKHLNAGQQRMNLGNRLRRYIIAGKKEREWEAQAKADK